MSSTHVDSPMVRIPRSAEPVPTTQRLREVGLPVPVFMATVALLVPLLIFGSIQLGWFGATGRVDAATGQTIELTADSVGDDIRGWMTLDQVLDGFGLSRAELNAAFPTLAGVDSSLKMGEISESTGLELDALRTWIDDQRSGAATPITEPTASGPAPSHSATGTPSADGEGVPPTIRGRTTVAELLDSTGVPIGELVAQFDLDPSVSTDTRLVDLVDRAGNAIAVDGVREWADSL